MNKIVENKKLSENVVKMVFEAPVIAQKRKAGQYQIVGKTTAKLSQMKAGDSLQDVQGPLGNPTEIENFGRVVCVGGGVGVGVVYPLIVALKKAGNEVISIIGSRTKDLLILEKEIGEF